MAHTETCPLVYFAPLYRMTPGSAKPAMTYTVQYMELSAGSSMSSLDVFMTNGYFAKKTLYKALIQMFLHWNSGFLLFFHKIYYMVTFDWRQ